MSTPSPPRFQKMLDAMVASGAGGLTLPPPVFVEMKTHVRDYNPGEPETHLGATLIARFPVEQRYENPIGIMQGGMIAAAVDNVLGPLSYLVAPPSVTTQLAMTYLAPVTREMELIEITGTLTARSGRTLVFDAIVTDPNGATLATARATCTIHASPAESF